MLVSSKWTVWAVKSSSRLVKLVLPWFFSDVLWHRGAWLHSCNDIFILVTLLGKLLMKKACKIFKILYWTIQMNLWDSDVAILDSPWVRVKSGTTRFIICAKCLLENYFRNLIMHTFVYLWSAEWEEAEACISTSTAETGILIHSSKMQCLALTAPNSSSSLGSSWKAWYTSHGQRIWALMSKSTLTSDQNCSRHKRSA